MLPSLLFVHGVVFVVVASVVVAVPVAVLVAVGVALPFSIDIDDQRNAHNCLCVHSM